MKTRKINDHKNYEYLKELNNSMEDIRQFLIDFTLDEIEYDDILIPVEHAIFDMLDIDWMDLSYVLSSRNVTVILYKGILHLLKRDADKMEKQLNSFSSYEEKEIYLRNLTLDYSFIQSPKLNEIIADFPCKTRSYFMDVETTMESLNIGFSELNRLINEGIIKVAIRRIKVYFYSYQIKEILHILKEGEDHWIGW